MKALLDTNVFIWALRRPQRLTEPVLRLLEDETAEFALSVASIWEISTKVRLGKLPGAVPIESGFPEIVTAAGYQLLPITAEVALRSARLPGEHRDPFDRIVAAHALAEDIAVMSPDKALDSFGVRRIW